MSKAKDKPFRPMLAADAPEDLNDLRFPLLISPKLDGFRAVIHTEGARTRSMKPLDNRHSQALLSTLPVGLDGEVGLVGTNGAMDFKGTTSALRRFEGEPDIRYFVFDRWDLDLPYEERLKALYRMHNQLPNWVKVLPQEEVKSVSQVLAFYEACLTRGEEGAMLRDAKAPYKNGRSTLKEHGLLKLKPWKTEEALCIGMEPEYENTNEAELDERGYTKRSTKQEGMVARERMGKMILQNANWPKPFSLGVGFTHAMKEDYWKRREEIIGKEFVTYEYCTVGSYEAPRIPTFKGFRAPVDMDADQVKEATPKKKKKPS